MKYFFHALCLMHGNTAQEGTIPNDKARLRSKIQSLLDMENNSENWAAIWKLFFLVQRPLNHFELNFNTLLI